MIQGFDAIADARGRPNRFGEESSIAGLYFVGFKNPPTGALREIALEAPRVARAIRVAVGAKHLILEGHRGLMRRAPAK